MTPLFIVFEGIDGCGKTTQLRRLDAWLAGRGRRPHVVHSPGTTALGRGLRRLLLDPAVPLTAEQQALLFTADRNALRDRVGELRRAGHDVLCSRWLLSTLVYQGMIGRVGVEAVRAMHDNSVRLDPDVYVLLDLPAEKAVERVRKRDAVAGHARDRFELEPVEVYDDRRRCFKVAAEDHPRAVVVDADQPEDAVFADVLEACGRKSEGFKGLAADAAG